MAGVKKTAKNMLSETKGYSKEPWKALDPVRTTKDSLNNHVGVFEPDIPELPEETIIPIPDQKYAALEAKRRRAKGASTGRDSTILTEGLGG